MGEEEKERREREESKGLRAYERGARAQGVKSARERAFETRYFKMTSHAFNGINGNVFVFVS